MWMSERSVTVPGAVAAAAACCLCACRRDTPPPTRALSLACVATQKGVSTRSDVTTQAAEP